MPVDKNLSIILIIEAPFAYEILSKISLISSGWPTGIEIGWEVSKASILRGLDLSYEKPFFVIQIIVNGI